MNRTRLILILVVALFAVGCNGNDAATDDDGANGAEAGTEQLTVSAVDIDYEPDSIDIAAGTTVEVTVENDGNIEHDFEFDDGSGTGMLQPGESATEEFGPFEETTTAYCTVPGHREAGMEFDFVVE